MACTPPEPGPEMGPHWKVNWRAVELEPAKVTAELVAAFSPTGAITTTEDTRPPLATTCVEAIPVPTLVVASVGLSSTSVTGPWTSKVIVTPGCGCPRESMARKRGVVTSPSRGWAGDTSTNSRVAGSGEPHAASTPLVIATQTARPRRIREDSGRRGREAVRQ